MNRRLRAALAVIAITAAACSTPAPTKAPAPSPTATSAGDAFMAWYNGGGNQRIKDIGADVTALTATPGPPAADSLCQTLSNHVTSAIAYGPIPEAEGQKHWGNVLDLLGRSATECLREADKMDGVRAAQARIDLEAAQREAKLLQAWLDLLAKLAG